MARPACWKECRIGDGIVHGGKAAGSDLKHQHLDWSWFGCENAGAHAGQVAADVDQDVDAVGSHQIGDRLISEAARMAESRGYRQVACSDAVRGGFGEIRIEVEGGLLRVMRFDQRQEVIRMRAEAEHAVVDIADLQAAIGVGLVRVRRGGTGERVGEAAVHVSAERHLILGRQVRIEMEVGQEVPMGLGIAGREREDDAPGAHEVAQATLMQTGEGQRQVRLRCLGRETDRPLAGDGRILARRRVVGMRHAEPVPALGRGRQERKRAAKVRCGAWMTSGASGERAQPVLGLGRRRIEGERAGEEAGMSGFVGAGKACGVVKIEAGRRRQRQRSAQFGLGGERIGAVQAQRQEMT